jgi:uncharacterized membrane protein YcaP (DUF421 family)
MRIMGKRQIGELQPFELVIAIMLSELAAVPMQDTAIPLLYGIIPILTLMVLQILISLVTLKFQGARKLICGMPSILIENGQIKQDELIKQRLNLDDLMEDLRMSGYINISEISYAILENSGKLSIIPKAEHSPLCRDDLNLPVSSEKLPIGIILDGKLNSKNLQLSKHNLNWLMAKLKQQGINSIEDVFIAMLDSHDELYIERRDPIEK